MEIVYEYGQASGAFRREITEFPAITYYDNGVLEAKLSHMQGLGGEFCPYTLYQYQPETDAYALVASVDAWDRVITDMEVNQQGEKFPKAVDKDGAGLVYYIMGEDLAHDKAVDNAYYDRWRASYMDGAFPIEVPFQNLTQANIDKVWN